MSDQDSKILPDRGLADSPAIESAAQLDKFCDDPDVILLVGPDKVPIGVDSHCLRHASKVFKAMYSLAWAEGTRLSQNSGAPFEHALPEDDAEAMHRVCCVIHGRSDLVPDDLSASQILQIAIATDKYDMLTAMRYASKIWLDMGVPLEMPDEDEAMLSMACLLAAAYLFGEADKFRFISTRLMFGFSYSYRNIGEDSCIVGILGGRCPLLLEERRSGVIAEIHQKILDDAKNVCECGYGKIRGERYKALLEGPSFQPLQLYQIRIEDLIRDVKNSLPEHAAHAADLSCRTHCQYRSSGSSFCATDGMNSFVNKLEEWEEEYTLSFNDIDPDTESGEDEEME